MIYSTIRARFTLPDDPPYFIGSQIRGALGYALKRTVCINPAYQCEGCFAADNCLYYDFYESQNGYHPYRLDFELGKSYYDFSLYLFEKATEKLPYIVSALHVMLTQNGLGKERVTIDEYQLFVNGTSAVEGGKIVLPPETTVTCRPPQQTPSTLTLRFVTPLRIKHHNRFVRSGDYLTLRGILHSIYQRRQMLEGAERGRLPFEPRGEIVDRFVRFKDLSRYSGRQRGTLKIGGMVGEMTIEGIDPQSYALLKLGEIIGAGKQTVFGLGKIEVVGVK